MKAAPMERVLAQSDAWDEAARALRDAVRSNDFRPFDEAMRKFWMLEETTR